MGKKIKFDDGTFFDEETGEFTSEGPSQNEIQRPSYVPAQTPAFHSYQSPPRQDHTRRNILIAAAVILALIVILPRIKKPTQPAVTEAPDSSAPPPSVYASVISDGLNVRSGPSPKYDIITVIYRNYRVQILEGSGNVSNNWQKIRYEDYEGWVDSGYLTAAP
jgi:hypothetical protein